MGGGGGGRGYWPSQSNAGGARICVNIDFIISNWFPSCWHLQIAMLNNFLLFVFDLVINKHAAYIILKSLYNFLKIYKIKEIHILHLL